MLKHSPTVLLLDDFPDAVEAVATWLTLQGWRVLCTSCVEDALSALAREPVDVVLMEPRLREGCAMAVAQAARAVEARRPLLIAASGSVCSARERRVFDYTFVKPLALPALAMILRSHRRATSAASTAHAATGLWTH